MERSNVLPVLISTLVLTGSALAGSVVTTFDSGDEGWTGPTGIGGATVIQSTGGNPGANLRTVFQDFGITFRNSTNPDFVKDLSENGSVTISIDVRVREISGFGGPVTRPWVLEFRDYDAPRLPGLPWGSVWFEFAWVGADPNYVTWEVTITDPSAEALPAGWGGYGDEGPFGEPLLHPDATFAGILAGYDEIVFTTLEPGFFFTMDNYDVQIDNIRIDTEPGGCDGDLDGDGNTGFTDLNLLLAEWGACPDCPEDLDGDDNVGFSDLNLVLSGWGACL